MQAPYLVDEAVPLLRPWLEPPVVFGTAVLATACMHGATPQTLALMIDQHDAGPIAKLYDTSIGCQLAFSRPDGLRFQNEAIAASPLFRIRREHSGRDPIRLLALVSPGDMMANTPLDFITNHLDVQLDLLFMVPHQALPETIPDHDLIFFAAAEPELATLSRMRHLFHAWPRPALNDPGLLPELNRDRLARLLAPVPGLCSPATQEVTRSELLVLASDAGPQSDFFSGVSYPVLIRPAGSHAGLGLVKLGDASALAPYLQGVEAPSYYVTAFIDYRAPDGLYRKYRIAFIEGEPHLCHMAVSQHWMVHYLNAGMLECEAKRAEEAAAMAQFATGFAARHREAFAALHALLPFDYYSIDCSELQDGRLLVFEADTAAIVHLMDPAETFPYKHAYMRAVFDAFGAMLRRRMSTCLRMGSETGSRSAVEALH